MSTPPLEADGNRPAVAWVTSLPASWTSPRQRLLLLALAIDSYDQEPPFTSSASADELSAWTGERRRSRLFTTIRELEADDLEVPRPPLLEVARGRGRSRSTYRLRAEVGNPLWSTRWNHKGVASSPPGGTTTAGDSQSTRWNHNGSSGRASGPPSSPPGGTTPYPALSTHLPPSTTEHAREVLEEAGITGPIAEEVIRRATADPETRDVARRLAQPAYRHDLLARVEHDRRQSEAERRSCPHGRVDGMRVTGDGHHASRICGDCEAEHPASRTEVVTP